MREPSCARRLAHMVWVVLVGMSVIGVLIGVGVGGYVLFVPGEVVTAEAQAATEALNRTQLQEVLDAYNNRLNKFENLPLEDVSDPR